MARTLPSFATIGWGVVFGLIALAIATRVDFVNKAVAGDLPLEV